MLFENEIVFLLIRIWTEAVPLAPSVLGAEMNSCCPVFKDRE